MNIFLNPTENYIPLIVMGVVVIAACIGLAFLIKMIYNKYCLEKKELKT